MKRERERERIYLGMLSLEGPLVAEQKMEVGGECLDEERRLWVPFEGNIIKGLEEPNLESEEVGDGKLEQKLKVAIVVGSAAHHPSDC